MNDFALSNTVKTSFFLVKDSWRDLLRAAKWPAIAFIPAIGIYILVSFLRYEVNSQSIENNSFEQMFAMFWPIFLALIPVVLVVLAFNLNWQAYLMGSPNIDVEPSTLSSDPIRDGLQAESDDWFYRFKLCALRYLQLLVVTLVPYLLCFVLFAYAVESSQLLASLMFLALFVIIIVSMPYMARAALVFPAVAAGLPEPTFENAFQVSQGLGWRMVGANILSMLVLQVALAIIAIIFAILGAIVAVLFGNLAVSFLGLLFLLFYPFFLLVIASVYTSIPALVLMQLLPAYADRWQELSDTKKVDQNSVSNPEYGQLKK
jgi:hypothetical protein